MAHLITGNKFDPNKDIPDLSGKVCQLLFTVQYPRRQPNHSADCPRTRYTSSRAAQQGSDSASRPTSSSTRPPRSSSSRKRKNTPTKRSRSSRNPATPAKCTGSNVILKDLKKTNEVAKRLTSEKQFHAVRAKTARNKQAFFKKRIKKK